MAASKPVWRLEVGDEAPDFRLKVRGRKNVVLVFFPAAFTPV
jgi:peroxiredoxin